MDNVDLIPDDLERESGMAAKALEAVKRNTIKEARKSSATLKTVDPVSKDETTVQIVITTSLRPWAMGQPMEHNQIYEVMRWEADLIAANGHGVIIPEGKDHG